MTTAWCHLLRVLAFLCTCTKNLHIDLDLDLCSAHLDLRSACLLFCARRSSFKNWWRNAREKRFFACFFVLVRKKICIFIWSIRPVHAMLRTCKKWHHVHAMLCTRFCIKKKWTSHSSQIIIVSEQGKTTIRREENERGTIHDIKKQYVFRHHPDCIFYIYVKGWQDDTAKD